MRKLIELLGINPETNIAQITNEEEELAGYLKGKKLFRDQYRHRLYRGLD